MTSHPGLHTITIHILPNISRSKDNQMMKLGQLIEYNKIFFFKNRVENEAGKLVPNLFLKKALYEVKANGLQLDFDILR